MDTAPAEADAAATGRVLWHTTMSLDGYIAGPEDATEWVLAYQRPPVIDQLVATTGAILIGRRSYDVSRDANQLKPEPATRPNPGSWSGPQFVLTHHVDDTPEDPSVTFLSGDVREAVSTALAAANGKNVVVIGANIARQCLGAGLIDEILIHVAPVLLGGGVPLHDGVQPDVTLQIISVAQSGQFADLWYRVVR